MNAVITAFSTELKGYVNIFNSITGKVRGFLKEYPPLQPSGTPHLHGSPHLLFSKVGPHV